MRPGQEKILGTGNCGARIAGRGQFVRASALFALLFIATMALCQSPPDASLKPREIAHEGKNQVSLYVALHDKKGRTLGDLKPGDLVITDAGHPVDSREVQVTEDNAADGEVITFLFDRLDAAGAKNATRDARSILKNLGESTVPVSIWAVGDRLRIVQSYTSDRALIDRAIDEVADGPLAVTAAGEAQERILEAAGKQGDRSARTAQQKRWDACSIASLNEAQRVAFEQRAPWAIASLLAAAHAQHGLRGRKALVVFTQVVPTDLNSADMLRAASHSLRDASISVFAIDLNSLDESSADGMQAAAAMGQQATYVKAAVAAESPRQRATLPMGLTPLQFKVMNDTIAGLEFDGLKGNENLLGLLSLTTGGLYTSGDLNSRKVSREILAQLRSYYTISYPEASRLDGRFHPVHIKAVGPGVKVEAQPGYFGTAPLAADAADVTHAGSAIEDVDFSMQSLSEGISNSDLSVNAAVLRFGRTASGTHGIVALEVPIRELQLHEDPNTALFSLHATVGAELKNSAGQTVARFHEEFRRHGSLDGVDQERSQFLSLQRSVNLPPGDYRLEASVRDWNADRFGRSMQNIHLDNGDDANLISDLVLVRSIEDKKESADSDMLSYGESYVVPNIAHDLGDHGRKVSVYFQLYPDAKKAEAARPENATLRLNVAKDGKLLATLPLHMDTTNNNMGSSSMASVTLGNGAGMYELTLYLDHAGRTTSRELSVSSTGVEHEVSNSSADAPTVPARFEPPSLDAGFKTGPDQQLAPEQSSLLLADARASALAYTQRLPNFMCVETVNRSIDPRGTGAWKHRDSIVELLRYAEKNESRTVLTINGQKAQLPAGDLQGAHSNGEFGGILQIIFDPDANAQFKWQSTEVKDGQTLQAFSYKVDAEKSQFFLTDHSGDQIRAPFHGVVLIDNDTRSVRRLVAETDLLPKDFGIKASWMTIDYDYIGINGHEYLLPTSGEVGLKQGRNEAEANEMHFTDYRRFGSRSRILTGPVSEAPQ